MREIIFRGMDINGCWSYGYLSEMPHGFRVEKGWYISNSSGMAYAYKVRPETIGQYTGLKDKNGGAIYEGDILDFKTSKSCYSNYSGKEAQTIIINNGACRFCETDMIVPQEKIDRSHYEVVGNIYE